MKIIKNIIFIVALVVSATTFSQEKENIEISILVKNSRNESVPGAIILFDDVKQNRTTNARGYFKINLKKAPKEICAFSPTIGIKKIAYTGLNTIVIQIREGNETIISDNPQEKISDPMQFKNIYDYLRGKVPGVNINQNNTINIRGIGSINGNTAPLLILNGMPIDETSFGNIVPTTIQSVKIIKGPETAIYGSRGANGVIEVTTII